MIIKCSETLGFNYGVFKRIVFCKEIYKDILVFTNRLNLINITANKESLSLDQYDALVSNIQHLL